MGDNCRHIAYVSKEDCQLSDGTKIQSVLDDKIKDKGMPHSFLGVKIFTPGNSSLTRFCRTFEEENPPARMIFCS